MYILLTESPSGTKVMLDASDVKSAFVSRKKGDNGATGVAIYSDDTVVWIVQESVEDVMNACIEASKVTVEMSPPNSQTG